MCAGCDRHELLEKLSLVYGYSPSIETWEFNVSRNLRKLKALFNRVRKCADDIESLNNTPFGVLLLARKKAGHSWQLPEALREYCSRMENFTQTLGPKKRPILRTIISSVFQYVIEKTGRPHDRQVADLISALSDNPKYDAETHKMLRLKDQKEHCKLDVLLRD